MLKNIAQPTSNHFISKEEVTAIYQDGFFFFFFKSLLTVVKEGGGTAATSCSCLYIQTQIILK